MSFQLSHFGDGTRPETFFVEAEEALYWRPDVIDDDGLGWYGDGVKRTLTDEQIEMFRHTERAQLELKQKRERRALQQDEGAAEDAVGEPAVPDDSGKAVDVPAPPATKSGEQNQERTESLSARSDSARSTFNAPSDRRKREKEIPYDQRHKRKWEKYVRGQDPVHGSLTQRRLARELDEQQNESVDMDYGDDAAPGASRAAPPAAPDGRRVVSYADD